MQIQRIQSVYIFLAVIAMAIFLIVPYGEIVHLEGGATELLYTMPEYGVLIPSGTIVILLLVGLFMYRNLQLQRTVIVISLMLTLAVCAVVCFALYKVAAAEGLDAHFTMWDILLPITAVLEILAVSGINKDMKLLRSYDRLR
ncbi:MAG: DUF4293 domain-containing protein [Muribaculaceae bacterium]|nr:DUF4293 domain-containing protein [Muribaculaceae bacterium]